MTSNVAELLDRNQAFAASTRRKAAPSLPFLPHQRLYILTCLDCRVDPAEFLGLSFGEALVERNIGGRLTPLVVQDIAYASYLVESKAPDGPYFEVAIIHHTDCGSRLLENDELRHGFARRTGYFAETLADIPATDPAQTVRVDVERLRAAPQISRRITISGHVYDVDTGLLTTVVEPTSPAIG
jgi:carbonic anhydrase